MNKGLNYRLNTNDLKEINNKVYNLSHLNKIIDECDKKMFEENKKMFEENKKMFEENKKRFEENNKMFEKYIKKFDEKLKEVKELHTSLSEINNSKKRKDYLNNEDINKYLNRIEINEISLKKYNKQKCIICLDNYSISDKICFLPCLHYFHFNCIKNWVKESNKCPICKHNIKKNE